MAESKTVLKRVRELEAKLAEAEQQIAQLTGIGSPIADEYNNLVDTLKIKQEHLDKRITQLIEKADNNQKKLVSLDTTLTRISEKPISDIHLLEEKIHHLERRIEVLVERDTIRVEQMVAQNKELTRLDKDTRDGHMELKDHVMSLETAVFGDLSNTSHIDALQFRGLQALHPELFKDNNRVSGMVNANKKILRGVPVKIVNGIGYPVDKPNDIRSIHETCRLAKEDTRKHIKFIDYPSCLSPSLSASQSPINPNFITDFLKTADTELVSLEAQQQISTFTDFCIGQVVRSIASGETAKFEAPETTECNFLLIPHKYFFGQDQQVVNRTVEETLSCIQKPVTVLRHTVDLSATDQIPDLFLRELRDHLIWELKRLIAVNRISVKPEDIHVNVSMYAHLNLPMVNVHIYIGEKFNVFKSKHHPDLEVNKQERWIEMITQFYDRMMSEMKPE